MRRIFNTGFPSWATYMLCAALTMFMYGCSDDDDEIYISSTPQSSKTVEEINLNISALQRLLLAAQGDEKLLSCVKVSNSSYSVELEDGDSFTLYTTLTTLGSGTETVYSPVVSAKEDNGVYYWTVDGSYLTIDGNKQTVDDAVPVVGIDDDNYWTVTLGGAEQRYSAVADGVVASLFTSVTTGDTEVTFAVQGSVESITLDIKTGSTGALLSPTYTLRRPIDPDHPAWLVHIDTWATPDPQAIIDLIPEDIRPYVIFNIALSTSNTDGVFDRVPNGYETAKSWLRTCAANNVWAMVQGASGALCHWPDVTDYSELAGTVFEDFYQHYPNFVGFNYAEQGWGWGDDGASTYAERVQHFSQLMRLSNEYGGYLCVSFFNTDWDAEASGVGMIKKSSAFAEACRQWPENFIACEKYTQSDGFFDMESTSMGVYASGFAGNYGIRFDQCGWYGDEDAGTGWNGDIDFPVAAGAIPVVEHVMLTGQTVIDGPELTWQQCITEGNSASTTNGYSKRTWSAFSQFTNISMDIFRKIIDGTIRIMTRQEVIDRTKVVLVNDRSATGARFDPGYCPPETLFDGLYILDEDGTQRNNHLWFKKTGRYPTIPTVAELADDLAKSFDTQLLASQFTTGSEWNDVATKQSRFNEIFPEEYTTDGMYAGRHENGWVVYNPYADDKTADIPFKYNTCEKMVLTFGKYSLAVVKEYSQNVDFYLTNYSTDGTQTTDVITLYGCSARPTYSYSRRVSGNSCSVVEDWDNGTFTLTVKHNGALDLAVSCSGSASARETAYTAATVSTPPAPPIYEGTRQYEAEYFEYQNVGTIVKVAGTTSGAYSDFTALGYMEFGTKSNAAVRTTVSVAEAGVYYVRIRYCAPTASLNTIDLYLNGSYSATPTFSMSGTGDAPWRTVSVSLPLAKGDNVLELKANNTASGTLYLDNITISGSASDD